MAIEDWQHIANVNGIKVVIDTNHIVNHILIMKPGYELWRGKTLLDAVKTIKRRER